ncbi:MAG: two-component system sensor histidine kinase NtrB [Spirochaetota bacterium]
MRDNPELPAITALLKQIAAGKYEPLEADTESSAETREFVRAINSLADQRDELLRSYNEDLRRSELRLRGIIESTPVGICITDEHGYYEYVNPTYCRLYGYEPEDLIGNHFTIVVPEQNRERLIHLHSEFMGRRYELRGEWEVLRRDGTPMAIIADAAYIIDVDGRPKKVTFVLDISERKHAERMLQETVSRLNEEIRQREELEKVKVQVERMIRHDLRNPLNGIIAAAEILMVDELSDEQRELCMIIRESGRKLDSMLSSSMDLIKMEEGSYALQAQPLNLIAVLQEVRRELEPLAGNARVQVQFRVDGDPLSWSSQLPMEGEKLYLADALANVVRNAIEASGDDDTVTVSVTTGDRYRIDVHNTGVVPEEIRRVFFDRYATSGKRNGTGLGTYVAALITRVHRGSITFTTSEAEGTTVTIELPRKQPRD